MIGIIDYGLGNMFSLANALAYCRAEFTTVYTPDEIEKENLDGLILPGVGAFPQGMRKLNECGLGSYLKQYQKPLLGICLGMQLLFEEGEEFERTLGLGLINGRVVKIEGKIKIPHVGWNELNIKIPCPLTQGLASTHMYFVHSYKAVTNDNNLIASADYHQTITAIAGANNVYGTQFHPEKSGDAGLQLLKNFINLCEVNK